MKAIDIWLLTCFGITFLALLEYCIVLVLKQPLEEGRKGQDNKHPREGRVIIANNLEHYSGIVLSAIFYLFAVTYFIVLGPIEDLPMETPDSVLQEIFSN